MRIEGLEHRCLLAQAPLPFLATDSGQDLYSELHEIPASPIGAASYIQPEQFTAFRLNREALETQLVDVPMEFTAAADAHSRQLLIPRPDGTLSTFEIVESPIMAPELAAQFPEIKTYRGFDVNDPSASLRFDLTPQGFHVQVLGPHGTYYVDPYYHLDQSVYVSYWRENFALDPETQRLRSEVLQGMPDDVDESGESGQDGTGGPEGDPGGVAERTGMTLRTYRAAVAATGEYTAFHGGTQVAGQAAIVTAMNRVTGVYEVELTIRMQLVPNNTNVVFTNAATDPYTNNNGFTMLGQNQATMDSALIGSPNYDIGHVFSTGGGGVAGLGVVGIAGNKARGVTGLPSPIGDPFYIDYVAHEMGHQFGGAHTFNSPTGSCNGNGTSSSAYEPGSGSTIQAYAGICGADNLQNNSDAYFHSRSFDQMISFVDTSIPAVGTRTPTGNSVPTANAGANYTIPTGTPFRVTGSGTDADPGDVLTYNWEERDLGPFQTLAAADNGTSPIFRSWTATTSPTRYFPRLSNVVSNTLPKGEKYPALARTLRLRLTVRDNRSGAGGINTDDMQISVINTGAPFAVTAPNTNVSWTAGSTENVTWNVSGTNAGSVNTPNVNILFSTDGGLTYPTTLATDVPNDGSHMITVPNVDTTQARILVEGAGNIFFDISNANFRVIATDVSPPTAVGTAPDITTGGATSYTLSVTYTDNVAVDASDIGEGADIEVVAPDSSVLPASFVSRSTDLDTSPINATFTINAPGGTWNSLDNGVYTIRTLAGSVSDTSNNLIGAGNIGSFTVNVPPPGSSCSDPAPAGVLDDSISDFFYNPVTGVLSTRIDSTNLPSDGLSEIYITGPAATGTPAGAPNFAFNVYVGGEQQLLVPIVGTPGLESDLPLLQYAAGLSAGDFGCMRYVTAGAGSPQETIYTQVSVVTDTVVPTASSNPADIESQGGATHSFDVVFSDNMAVQGTDIKTGVIRVTGPNGYDQIATRTAVNPPSGNTSPITGTFQITAPGGTWDAADEGTYQVEVAGFTVTDLSNNFVAGATIASFDVDFASGLTGDFDNDGDLDCTDVNALSTAIATGSTDLQYDVTDDGEVDADDLQEWVLNLKQTLFGDADLNFSVDGSDFGIWNANKFTSGTDWCRGDFNADGASDGSDFGVWNANKFQSVLRGAPAPLPAAGLGVSDTVPRAPGRALRVEWEGATSFADRSRSTISVHLPANLSSDARVSTEGKTSGPTAVARRLTDTVEAAERSGRRRLAVESIFSTWD